MSEADRIKELESEMLNNAKTARLIIDGLESRLAKAVGALKDTKKAIEGHSGDTIWLDPAPEALCPTLWEHISETIEELEGA